MELVESFTLILASAIAFPLLLDWHKARLAYARSKLSDGQSLSFWQRIFSRATVAAIFLAALLVAIPFAIGRFSSRNGGDASDFAYFDLATFKEELDEHSTAQGTSLPDFTDAMRIFRHAEELKEKKHLKEAERILLQIKRGKDEHGQFPTINSFVIENNLGVLAYSIRRNKNFDSSAHLLSAKGHPKLPAEKAKDVESNLSLLNEAVNTLD